MSDENGEVSPGTEQAAVSEQAAPEKITPTEVGAGETADASDAEIKTSEETTEESSEESTEEKPRKRTSAERARRKISYMAGALEQKDSRIQELERQVAAKTADPKPDPSKYSGGEYDPKFIEDTMDYKINERSRAAAQNTPQPVNPDFVVFQQNAKQKFPDLEKRAGEFMQEYGALPEYVAGALFKAKHGPAVLNHIISNPDIADELSDMKPVEAILKIGELNAAFSSQLRKQVTQTKPPLNTPKGGASAAFDPATASMDEYVAKRKAGWGK